MDNILAKPARSSGRSRGLGSSPLKQGPGGDVPGQRCSPCLRGARKPVASEKGGGGVQNVAMDGGLPYGLRIRSAPDSGEEKKVEETKTGDALLRERLGLCHLPCYVSGGTPSDSESGSVWGCHHRPARTDTRSLSTRCLAPGS